MWPVGGRVGVFVSVEDSLYREVPGVTVTLEVARGGGRLDRLSMQTGADGRPQVVEWTLGTVPGINELRAVVSDVPPATFTMEGVAADPSAVNGDFLLVGMDEKSLPLETGWNHDRFVVTRARLAVRDTLFSLDMDVRAAGQPSTTVRRVTGMVKRWGAVAELFPDASSGGTGYFGSMAVASSDGRVELVPDDDGFGPLISLVINFRRVP